MVVEFHYAFELVGKIVFLLGFVIENYDSVMLDLFWVVVFVLLVYMAQNYLVDLCCKNEVSGFDKVVDDFDYNIPHHLMENK